MPEREAKFVVEERKLMELARLPQIGPYPILEGTEESQSNTYLDTEVGELGKKRWALRMREVAGRATLTLKGEGTVRKNFLEREEEELEISVAEARRVLRSGELPAGAFLSRAVPRHGLRPILHSTTLRHKRAVVDPDGGTLAWLVLDRVSFEGEHRAPHHCEVELELVKQDGETVLEDLVRALQLLVGHPPERRSKLEIGLGRRSAGRDFS